jgi:hypothetical protein
MSWIPNATVTINGTSYESNTLAGLQITYGRATVWEQARAGYAQIQILNTTNANNLYEINDSVIITIDDSSGNPVTIFTGKLHDITAQLQAVGDSATVAVETLTAVSIFADMARVVVGTSNYPKEYDNDRIDRIFTEAGVPIDVVDVGVYEFTARAASPSDAYSLAANYAQQAFGYIYETTAGEVGFANESRRTATASSQGYFIIDPDYILWQGIQSTRSFNDITNDVLLTYKNSQTVTASDATSIATYGTLSASISTELEQTSEAQLNAQRYVTLRAYPETSVSSFTIQLDSDVVTNGDRDDLIAIYMGWPIQITTLPVPIIHIAYRAFVEGWTWNIRNNQAALTIISTDNTLSLAPTRWQDVNAALQWEDVDPALQWLQYE